MIRVKKRMLVLIVFVSLILTGCYERDKIYVKGSYIGTSEGYYSEIIVEVNVDEYNIISIEILENEEPPTLADIVFEKLPPKIIKKNNTSIDVISGATYTSNALLNAVENALEDARSEIE